MALVAHSGNPLQQIACIVDTECTQPLAPAAVHSKSAVSVLGIHLLQQSLKIHTCGIAAGCCGAAW